jgi:ketosteroid isomerase-like protein
MKLRSFENLVLLFVLGACHHTSNNHTAEEAKLMQLSRELSQLACTDSTEKILSYWADDAVVMPPGHPPIKGKIAIKNMLINKARQPGFKVSWEPKSATIAQSGEIAYLVEENQITLYHTLGKSFMNVNKGVSIWRKENGSWKKIVDIWNKDPFYLQ